MMVTCDDSLHQADDGRRWLMMMGSGVTLEISEEWYLEKATCLGVFGPWTICDGKGKVDYLKQVTRTPKTLYSSSASLRNAD